MKVKNNACKSGDRSIFGAYSCHLGGIITKRLFVNCSLVSLNLCDELPQNHKANPNYISAKILTNNDALYPNFELVRKRSYIQLIT